MITVILADDHKILIDGLRLILEKAGDIQILGIAANGQEAVEQSIRYQPDVVVMDVSMPVMDGLEATRQISVHCPKTRVLMLSMYNTPEYIRRSLSAGASGYVPKDAAANDLVQAVRALHEGNRYISDTIPGLAEHPAWKGTNNTSD